MAPVFGRHDPNPHPYGGSLDALLSGAVAERAVARNVQHDGRVTPKRERVFDRDFQNRDVGQGLLDALTVYKKRNRRLHQPDFNRPDLNGENFRSGRPGARDQIHKDVLLARVLEVNGLAKVIEAHGRAGRPEFRTFRDFAGERPELFDEWLDRELLSRQTPESFMKAILESLNESRRLRPFHPTWATYWDHLEPYLAEAPHRWLEAAGIHRDRGGCWVAILRYPVRDAGKVIRPTVLEAGATPEHFPTPERSHAGHPMDLGRPDAGAELLPELIHRQIDHDPDAHWHLPGAYLRRTEQPTSDDLERQRRKHLRRLETAYGHEVLAWEAI